MKRRRPASPPPDALVSKAMARLEVMLDHRSTAIRLTAARIILAGVGGAGPATTPGQSFTAAALRAEEELRRRGKV